MSIEGSLALVGLLLLALGVAVSARRATLSSTAVKPTVGSASEAASVDGTSGAATSSSNTVSIVLLVGGAVALLASGALVLAMWVLFSGLL